MEEIKKKVFYNLVRGEDTGFEKLQEFVKSLKKENIISISEGVHYDCMAKYTLFYWAEEGE